MGYLNTSTPADTDPVAQGASAIRSLETQLNSLISQIFADNGTFLSSWLTGSQIQPATIPGTALVANTITTSYLAPNAVALSQLAQQPTGSLLTYDGSQNPALLAPGAANTFLSSNGTSVEWVALPPPAHGVPVFISPAILASGTTTNGTWETITQVQNYASPAIPLTCSALILGCYSLSNTGIYFEVRQNSSAAVYYLQYGGGFDQILFAPYVNGTNLQFDFYQSSSSTNSGWHISLLGYIT